MSCIRRRLACMFQCSKRLNKKALCLKRAWDEVEAILSAACCGKKHRCKKK